MKNKYILVNTLCNKHLALNYNLIANILYDADYSPVPLNKINFIKGLISSGGKLYIYINPLGNECESQKERGIYILMKTGICIKGERIEKIILFDNKDIVSEENKNLSFFDGYIREDNTFFHILDMNSISEKIKQEFQKEVNYG